MKIQKVDSDGWVECQCGSMSFCNPYDARYLESGHWICARCVDCYAEIKIIRLSNASYTTTSAEKDDKIFTRQDIKHLIHSINTPKTSSAYFELLTSSPKADIEPISTVEHPPIVKGNWFTKLLGIK
jgi:hypothetical protein